MATNHDIYTDKTEYVKKEQVKLKEPPIEDLSASEAAAVEKQKEKLRFQNEIYIRQHPELRTMIHAFMTEVLEKRPKRQEIVDFAIDYFVTQKKQGDV